MSKKLTTEEFIAKARLVHGERFDYAESVYIDAKTPVIIKCNSCGSIFLQRPYSHLQGYGCDNCARHSPRMGGRKKIFGVGYFDLPVTRDGSKELKKAYSIWYGMLSRCYNLKFQTKQPSYIGCSVCEEWLIFSNFFNWFKANYKNGYELDKDVLVKNNRVYSPQTCSFIPKRINTLLLKQKQQRGDCPIGVNKQNNSYIARLKKNKKEIHIGSYKTKDEAFYAYKSAKEKYIKEVAQKYYDEGKITEEVYNALIKYKIEKTD